MVAGPPRHGGDLTIWRALTVELYYDAMEFITGWPMIYVWFHHFSFWIYEESKPTNWNSETSARLRRNNFIFGMGCYNSRFPTHAIRKRLTNRFKNPARYDFNQKANNWMGGSNQVHSPRIEYHCCGDKKRNAEWHRRQSKAEVCGARWTFINIYSICRYYFHQLMLG